MTRELVARAIDPDAWTERADMGMCRETSPDWRPIATAPKDGTSILAWSPDSFLGEPFIVQWNATEDPDGDDWYPQGGEGHPIDVEITHWQPLPAAPAEGQPR